MSAQHGAEMIVHHTQAASYHQGKEAGRQEAMRLVRQLNQRIQSAGIPFDTSDTIAALSHLEDILADLTRESERAKEQHNKVLREVDATLTAASNAISGR
jgi:hypothetical protein